MEITVQISGLSYLPLPKLWQIISHSLALSLGLGPYKKGTFDFSQNLTRTPSGDFKQVSEDFMDAGDLVVFKDFFL